MKNVNDIKEELAVFFENLKAEVIIAELLENSKMAKEDITILNKSTFTRGFRRDIVKTEVSENNKLQFQLSRNGIYDALPQNVFHSSIPINSKVPFSQTRQKSKKEEANARKLFAQIENEFFLHRVFIEQYEKELSLQFNNVENSFLLDFWGIKDKVDQEYIFLLVKALPLAYKISKDEKLIAQCLGNILNEKVSIEKKYVSLENNVQPNEDNNVLGVNASLALAKTNVLYPKFIITIELSDVKNEKKYAENGKGLNLISVFCEYFVPLEADWEIELTYKKADIDFKLNDESIFLGLSTAI